jgi:membrane protein DedA with SNARE-associated domain
MIHSLLVQLLPYDYFLLFIAITLEGFGIPVPGEVVLITSSVLAAQGKLSFVLVLLCGIFGAVAGNSIGYAICFFGGKKLLARFDLFKRNYEKVTVYSKKYGVLVIVFGRFFQGLRQLSGIFAGIASMPFRHFIIFNTLGAVLWVCAWGSIAFFFGKETRFLLHAFKQYEFIIVSAIILSLVLFAVLKIIAGRKKRSGPARNK